MTRKSRSTPSTDQAALPGLEFKKQLSFGGSLLKNSHAKVPRPLSSKQALHIVLRSDFAQQARSMLKHERVIQNTLLKLGRRHGVKVYRVSNAGNHLHLLVRFTKRRELQNFLRGSTGLIARKVMQTERGPARLASKSQRGIGSADSPSNKKRFWSQRPFTRIVSWGRDFDGTLNYLKLNSLEAFGFIHRKFTRALPTQAIRARVLGELSRALANIDVLTIVRAPAKGNLSA